MYSYRPPHMAVQKQDDQHEHTFSNYVRIRDVVQKTCLRRWTIGKSGERGSGISVLPARHDDDDDELIYHKTKPNQTKLKTDDGTTTIPVFAIFFSAFYTLRIRVWLECWTVPLKLASSNSSNAFTFTFS